MKRKKAQQIVDEIEQDKVKLQNNINNLINDFEAKYKGAVMLFVIDSGDIENKLWLKAGINVSPLMDD